MATLVSFGVMSSRSFCLSMKELPRSHDQHWQNFYIHALCCFCKRLNFVKHTTSVRAFFCLGGSNGMDDKLHSTKLVLHKLVRSIFFKVQQVY